MRKLLDLLEQANRLLVAPLLALVGGMLGLYYTVVKDRLEAQGRAIENTAKVIETELSVREFENNLKVQMYGEVKNAIADDNPKLQKAVLLLVNEMLADPRDTAFREKLITVLLASPQVGASVREAQDSIESVAAVFQSDEARRDSANLTLDIFYTDDLLAESRPRAQGFAKAWSLRRPRDVVRVRLLPRLINARAGYRISANEIRYESDEAAVAREILALARSSGLFPREMPRPREIHPAHPTPNYVTLFIRNM